MRVLVTWGSERGGTEGIARMIAQSLRRDGIEVVTEPADRVRGLDGFDAIVVGGALYAFRWHRAARRFVRRHAAALRRVPVWCFSSGPLDTSADGGGIEPTRQVAGLMAQIGALGHVTFGGRLAPDARGFAAHAMAKTKSGDWRNPQQIAAWADTIAAALPTARPAPVVPTHPYVRLGGHALLVAALGAAARLALQGLGLGALAITLHAMIVAAIAADVARHYVRAADARDPLPAAATIAIATLALDALALRAHLLAPIGAVAAAISVTVALVAAWSAGAVTSMIPTRRPAAHTP